LAARRGRRDRYSLYRCPYAAAFTDTALGCGCTVHNSRRLATTVVTPCPRQLHSSTRRAIGIPSTPSRSTRCAGAPHERDSSSPSRNAAPCRRFQRGSRMTRCRCRVSLSRTSASSFQPQRMPRSSSGTRTLQLWPLSWLKVCVRTDTRSAGVISRSESGERERALKGHTNSVSDVSFDKAGQTLGAFPTLSSVPQTA
jgi:hypothetical protein